MSYIFLSVQSKPFIKTILGALFVTALLWYYASIPYWILFLSLIVILVFFLLARTGQVTTVRMTDSDRIMIRRGLTSLTLTTPAIIESWWSYQFNTPNAENEDAPLDLNDLHVYLHIRDALGQEAVFTEYIGYDTRFPNETQYAVRRLPESVPVFRVQRADKLYAFLKKHLTADQLILPPLKKVRMENDKLENL